MAVTTTAFNNLIANLATKYPDIKFVSGDTFRWSSSTNTVFYEPKSKDVISLLHETAHALLSHTYYRQDIDLIHLERDAWTKAKELGRIYGYEVDDDTIEDALDSYRHWLHTRSLCPHCQQNGVQKDDFYSCLICNQRWKPNDARTCGLKRRKI